MNKKNLVNTYMSSTRLVNDKGELVKSTEFDYTGYETPTIPEDDCFTPYKRHQKSNVSHSSLKKVNRSAGISLLMKYKANHEANYFLNKLKSPYNFSLQLRPRLKA